MHSCAKTAVAALFTLSLFSCTSTQPTVETESAVKPPPPTLSPDKQTLPLDSAELTLEKIMADPDWLGLEPQDAYWADDGKSVIYRRKRQGARLFDLWQRKLDTEGNGASIELAQLHAYAYENRVLSADRQHAAWVFQGNIFVKDLSSNQLRQLTRSKDEPYNLKFLLDGRLTYQVGDAIYVISLNSGITQQLVSWRFADKPKVNPEAEDYLAEQQLELIDYVAKQRQIRQAREQYRLALLAKNASLTPEPFYFADNHRTVEASVSPDGTYLILVEQADLPSRSDKDIMPDYIGEDGRIKTRKVRARVADDKPRSQTLWLLDLQQGNKHKLAYQALPGYNEDVLAEVKKENAKARGEDYQNNRLPRDIGLMSDWYWRQSAIQWHTKSNQVAIMLEAQDNKDRWLASVDFTGKRLVNQHRLHDDAWINYKFNSFGWFNHSDTLYFLSEQSGYANLYVKPLNGKARNLTPGKFEVDELTLSQDDNFIYFQANKVHPGIYDIFRVNTKSEEQQTLTNLNGYTDYRLSPDESHLLLTHSKLTKPPELYVKSVADPSPARQLTDTASAAFKAIDWIAPHLVPVASAHTSDPIYSRVYLPADYQQGGKRRAVIFSHGAGYLQNAHMGWSGYFREFMFHNLLVRQGYVVMDMDYRASMGYGRDWRTAIYRQMGTPEVEDLQDGVNWLVENANVDRNRIGTYGGSYGGFITFMALFTQPDLFQAGAALRPVTDWAHYNAPYTSNILNTPDIDPIAYERSSPIYFAEGLNKPLLINAPMVDDNVFFVDVVRLVQRLIELEKTDFETAIYPVEPHGFVEPSSWLDEYRRIYKLFEQHL